MNTIKQGMTGYHIPAYMEEILTQNYCPYFVRMTIVRDGESYRFSYRPGHLTRLDTSALDTYNKTVLLQSVISVNEAAMGYLIGAENYLLEPELIYSTQNSTLSQDIRILFYPDIKRTQFTDTLEAGDINRAKMFLDKHILRIENRSFSKAG